MARFTPKKGQPFCYRLKITLVSSCWKSRYKGISRTIDMLSTATFEDLHNAIFDLFDRFDGHMWQFVFGAGSPWSGNAFLLVDPDAYAYDLDILPCLKAGDS